MSSLNIIKKYPELLELAYLSEREREHDLHAIFKRDIEDNLILCNRTMLKTW